MQMSGKDKKRFEEGAIAFDEHSIGMGGAAIGLGLVGVFFPHPLVKITAGILAAGAAAAALADRRAAQNAREHAKDPPRDDYEVVSRFEPSYSSEVPESMGSSEFGVASSRVTAEVYNYAEALSCLLRAYERSQGAETANRYDLVLVQENAVLMNHQACFERVDSLLKILPNLNAIWYEAVKDLSVSKLTYPSVPELRLIEAALPLHDALRLKERGLEPEAGWFENLVPAPLVLYDARVISALVALRDVHARLRFGHSLEDDEVG